MNTINNINLAVYEADEVVDVYKTIKLQPAEAILFYRYKADIDNQSVLDIGCGAGRTSYYLSKFTNHYTGLDYSSQMIAWCQSQYPDTSFIHGDVRDMNAINNNSIDFVFFSFNGIDYLQHEDRIKALNEIHRVLKPGGLFIFSTHNLDSCKTYPRPKLRFSLNPVNFLHNLLEYVRGKINYHNNAHHQYKHDDYEIIIDSGENFRLITYYISANKQTQQLAQSGFTMLELLDKDGATINPGDKNTGSAWINYVARKNT